MRNTAPLAIVALLLAPSFGVACSSSAGDPVAAAVGDASVMDGGPLPSDGGLTDSGSTDGGAGGDAGAVTPGGGGGTSAYKLLTTRPQTATTPIVFNFDGTLPAKNKTAVEPTTGATVRRLTDATIDTPNGGHLDRPWVASIRCVDGGSKF
jgi:hypothetical protein